MDAVRIGKVSPSFTPDAKNSGRAGSPRRQPSQEKSLQLKVRQTDPGGSAYQPGALVFNVELMLVNVPLMAEVKFPTTVTSHDNQSHHHGVLNRRRTVFADQEPLNPP